MRFARFAASFREFSVCLGLVPGRIGFADGRHSRRDPITLAMTSYVCEDPVSAVRGAVAHTQRIRRDLQVA